MCSLTCGLHVPVWICTAPSHPLAFTLLAPPRTTHSPIRRMWMLLQMHATHCTTANCQVPRCTQLRTIRRRQATRQEDKRRAAYRTMLRQQHGG